MFLLAGIDRMFPKPNPKQKNSRNSKYSIISLKEVGNKKVLGGVRDKIKE
jgi:hypothetical protein